jgi:peroxiredoxin
MLLRTLVLLFLLAISFCSVLRAQTISLYFPNEAGKEYALHLYQGQNTELVASGKMNAQGRAQIIIPASHARYSGIGLLTLDNGASNIQLIINGENFSIEADGDTDIIFKNSPENDYMIAVFAGRNPVQTGANMYAPRYLALLKYQNELQQPANIIQLRAHLRRNLDVEALYTSGLWNHIISGTFNLHRNKKDFGVDMVEVLKRTNNQVVFEALAEDLITICTQFGWETAQDEIVEYLISSQRILHPMGRLHTAFQQHKVRAGVKAPALINGNRKIELANTLLVFHETGCGSCEQQMQAIVRNYQTIRQRGFELVSVSADFEEETFKKSSTPFPWQMKLCDYKGFAGINFVNYGVVGTPTMYLINKDGIVEGRFARLQDIPVFGDLR